MIESLIESHRGAEVTVLVCEAGHRWCDAARRFIGPFQHAPATTGGRRAVDAPATVFHVQPTQHDRVRAAIQGNPRAVILWEITSANVAAVAATIAGIGVGRPDVLQCVVLDHGDTARLRDAALRLSEFGVAAIAERPEDLAIAARLIHRCFRPRTLTANRPAPAG
jgi:hypothetical protein